MGLVIILLACVILCVVILYRTGYSGKRRIILDFNKGRRGEARVRYAIGDTKPGSQYVINNLMLKVGEHQTSQIDHVLINSNGIFVIETKNYAGRIYGQENQHEWTQVLAYGRVKNKLYNPIKQNETHIRHISKVITQKHPIISVVVFVKGNTRFINADGVYSIPQLKRLIKQPHGHLTLLQMKSVYTELMNANDLSISEREHISNIHSMQKKITHNICPYCGKELVLKKGKYGKFYGCSGYPRCRFIKKQKD